MEKLRDILRHFYSNNLSSAASALRLAFHDCVGGRNHQRKRDPIGINRTSLCPKYDGGKDEDSQSLIRGGGRRRYVDAAWQNIVFSSFFSPEIERIRRWALVGLCTGCCQQQPASIFHWNDLLERTLVGSESQGFHNAAALKPTST